MKLFRLFNYEAVKFPEENLLLITRQGYLYFIYNLKNKTWQKYKYADEVGITTSNYQDATKEDICNALQGTFPTKPTDIMRLCSPEQLCIRDMIDLLHEDYETYMSYCNPINHFVLGFLRNSDLCHRSFLKIRDLLDNAVKLHLSDEEVLAQIKELSFSVIGRDIFKREIDIIDGLNASSYFWIEAARIIDYTDTNDSNNVAIMKNIAFSINNEDVAKYILPFLYKYFDNELEANKMRIDHHDGDWPAEDDETDENGDWPLEYVDFLSGGGGTYNFFTHGAVANMLKDIKDTIVAMSTGDEEKIIRLLYGDNLSDEQINMCKAEMPKEYQEDTAMIIDFYRRFTYRMEYMLRVSKEKGYDFISFMGHFSTPWFEIY